MTTDRDIDSLRSEFFGACTRFGFLEVAGVGGMAVVFKAWDRELDEVVAVKVLASSSGMPVEEQLARFKREVALNRRLRHPNIARVFDYGTAGGFSYLSMELIHGRALDSVLAGRGPLPADESLPILRQIALGIGAAHEAGIVHRDLKPQNVMTDAQGAVAILDFGLASEREPQGTSLTAPLSMVGTPLYMAPEQACGLPVDGRADLYALGVIAFEMMAGGVPFNAGSPDEVARMQVTDPAPIHLLAGKGVSRVVEEIVARCLKKEPAHRYQSARELEGALARAARLRPGELAGVLSEGALSVESGTLFEDTRDGPAGNVAGQGVDTWSAPSRDGPPLVLVVDDDPEFRRFAQLVLESFDCVVRTADDGETGLELLREDPPDLVLLDLWMPSIGGFGFLRSIPRRADASASFPVILVSGRLTRGIISQAMRIGVRDVLHKPLYPATLSERVWRVLAQEGFTPTS